MNGKALTLFTLLAAAGACASSQAPKREFFQRIWTKDLDPPYKTGNLPISSLTPTIHRDILFQGSLSGGFAAYALEDGRLLWKVQEKESISSPATPYGSTSILYADISGRLYARHPITGKLLYSFDVGSGVEGKIVFSGKRGLATTRNHSIICFDGETGKILWSFRRNIPYTTTVQGVATPLVLKNKVIVGLADGYLIALSLKKGQPLWERKISKASKFVDIDIDPKARRGMIYTATPEGPVMRVNPKNATISTHFQLPASSAPLFVGKKIFIGGADGSLYLFTGKGRPKKKIPLNPSTPSPVVHVMLWKKSLVAATLNGRLYRIDPTTLNVQSKFYLGHGHSALYAPPTGTERYLALMSSRNRLYVFQ